MLLFHTLKRKHNIIIYYNTDILEKGALVKYTCYVILIYIGEISKLSIHSDIKLRSRKFDMIFMSFVI